MLQLFCRCLLIQSRIAAFFTTGPGDLGHTWLKQPDMRGRDLAHKQICDEFKLNRGYVKRFLTQYLANHKRTVKRRKSSKSKKKRKTNVKQPKFFLQTSDPDTSDLSPWENGFTSHSDDDDPESPRARKKSRVTMKTKKKTKSGNRKEKTKNKSPTLPKVLESRMKESVDNTSSSNSLMQ